MTVGVTSSCKGCFAIEHRLKTTYSATAELFHYLVAAYLLPHKKLNEEIEKEGNCQRSNGR